METTLRLVNPRSQIQSRPLAPEPLDALEAATRIRRWGEERDWTGWDPYDALSSPWAGAVTLRTALGRRILTQAVKRSSVNLRPALRIPKSRNHKAIGLVASAYSYVGARATTPPAARAGRWLDWLEREHVGERRAGVGVPLRRPDTVLLLSRELAEHGRDDVRRSRIPRRGRAARRRRTRRKPRLRPHEFLVARMLVDGPRGPYFIYVPGDKKLIHNCNLLACATLIAGPRDARDVTISPQIAARAIATQPLAQRPDGSWPYPDWSGAGMGRQLPYRLRAGVARGMLRGRTVWPMPSSAGASYWEPSCSVEDGTPRYSPGRTEPLGRPLLRPGDRHVARLDAVGRPGLAQCAPNGAAPRP